MTKIEIIREDDVIVVGEDDNVQVLLELGDQGPPGVPGEPGPPSEVPGPPGPPGAAGTSILYGLGAPTFVIGHDGDFYIDTGPYVLYGPKQGSWPTTGTSLIGPRGPQGNTVLYGAVDPTAAVGIDGNFYINTTSHFMFGPKAAGAWPAGASLIGPQGIQGIPGTPGNTVLYGTTDPAGALGVDGNFYINTVSHYLFGPKAGGMWPMGTSLVGPQGIQGPKGDQGNVGPQGPGGTATCLVSDTPPAGAADGSLWFESDTGLLYFRFNDGTSTQWVIACPVPDVSAFLSTLPQALTPTQKAQTRTNISAAPFDAMAYSGLQVNGTFDITQVPASTTSGWLTDNWVVSIGKGMGALVTDAPPGLIKSQQMTVITPVASLGANDIGFFLHNMEGLRFARMGWGTPAAQPLTVAFWSKIHRPGTYSVAIGNDDQTRVYVTTFTHSIADAWEYKVITFPGDTLGFWPVSTTRGMYLMFVMAAGSAYSTSPNTWVSGQKYGATGMTNGIAAASDVFQIAGVIMLPGLEAPQKDRATLVFRQPDQELLLCQRQMQIIPGGRMLGQATSPTNLFLAPQYFTTMRAAPLVYLLKTSYSAAIYELMVGGNWVNAPSASINGIPSTDISSALVTLQGFSGMAAGQVANFNSMQTIVMLDARI